MSNDSILKGHDFMSSKTLASWFNGTETISIIKEHRKPLIDLGGPDNHTLFYKVTVEYIKPSQKHGNSHIYFRGIDYVAAKECFTAWVTTFHSFDKGGE